MLEWDHLPIVLAIHRGGSMQSAADTLAIDRATVLRRLDALEARLGARLFDRRRDGCVLTRAGLDIIGTVEGIAEAMTALELDDRALGSLVQQGELHARTRELRDHALDHALNLGPAPQRALGGDDHRVVAIAPPGH